MTANLTSEEKLHKRDHAVDLAITLVFLALGVFIISFEMSVFTGILWEFVFIGLMPTILVIYRREKWADYGVIASNAFRNLGLGLLVAAMPLFLIWMFVGNLTWTPPGITEALSLASPFKYPLAMLAGLTYFPLEMFFFCYLIVKFDRLFNSEKQVLSKGLLAAIIIFGPIVHGLTAWAMGLEMSLVYMRLTILLPFLIIGFIFKKTKSIVAPTILWMAINGTNF